MARFLQGEPSDAIAWLEKKEQLKDLKQKRNYYIRGLVVAPVTVLGVMLFRGRYMYDPWRSTYTKVLNGPFELQPVVVTIDWTHEIIDRDCGSLLNGSTQLKLQKHRFLVWSRLNPAVFGCVYWRLLCNGCGLIRFAFQNIRPSQSESGSGMSGLVKAISSVLSGSGGSGSGATGGGGTVIPFHEAAKYFNPAPLTYIAGAILAAAVDVLRSLNLLI